MDEPEKAIKELEAGERLRGLLNLLKNKVKNTELRQKSYEKMENSAPFWTN